MSKKKVIITIAAIAVAVGAGFGVYHFGDFSFLKKVSSNDKVYVQSVADIMNLGVEGQNRYSGEVQTQKTVKVNPDGDKKVKEILVAVGDQVEVGTPLFTYDMDEQEMNLAQLKLEQEEISTNITQYNKDLKELNDAKNAAPPEDQFMYVTDIQAKQAEIKQAEFDLKSKELEIENAQKSMEITQVESNTTGVIKTIKAPNDGNNSYNSYGSEEESMITIMELGNYRVKGTVNEQNYSSLRVGGEVIVRSRVDEDITWSGRIKSIDTENNKDSNDDYYYGDSGNSSSSYPFYVELDSTEGLIIGQHVLIEMNDGQEVAKSGLWLYESYVVTEDDESYVWVRSESDTLVKRIVELGEHDESLGEYEILSGLTEDDYIAFPLASFYEGIATVTDESEVDYSADIYNAEYDESSEDGYSDEESNDGDYLEDSDSDDFLDESEFDEDNTIDDSEVAE